MLQENQQALLHLKEQFNFSDIQNGHFCDFIDLFERYNLHTNLVSKNDVAKLASRHIFESLQILSLDCVMNAEKAMDLGSGGGFPGIPVSIMRSDLYVNLVESRKKKASFLQEAVNVLKLDNVSVFGERVEDLSIDRLNGPLDLIMVRAVASLSKLCEWGMPFLRKGGSIVTYKGGDIQQEISDIEDRFVNIHKILIPALDINEQRYFIQIVND